MVSIMLKVEICKANLAGWFVDKNKYLSMIACVAKWYLQVIEETEKAVKVVIFDERKNQTAETSNWTMWLPKSVCGFLRK